MRHGGGFASRRGRCCRQIGLALWWTRRRPPPLQTVSWRTGGCRLSQRATRYHSHREKQKRNCSCKSGPRQTLADHPPAPHASRRVCVLRRPAAPTPRRSAAAAPPPPPQSRSAHSFACSGCLSAHSVVHTPHAVCASRPDPP